MWLRTSSPSEVLTPSHARGPPALRIRHVRLVAASGRKLPLVNAGPARNAAKCSSRTTSKTASFDA